jgi:hypothetical protein
MLVRRVRMHRRGPAGDLVESLPAAALAAAGSRFPDNSGTIDH